ncbi:MAG: hypothetical protein RL701_2864 [Pseudomonadota bacterium]
MGGSERLIGAIIGWDAGISAVASNRCPPAADTSPVLPDDKFDRHRDRLSH